jgi:hypothetical protein
VVASPGPAGTVRALAEAVTAAAAGPPPPAVAFDLGSRQERLAELLARTGVATAATRPPGPAHDPGA